MKNGKIEKFTSYSQFQTVAEFNEHIKHWLEAHGKEFTKSERIGLTQLLRYSVKIVGVANVKIGTALKVIHEEYNGNEISRSTWKRMVAKATKIGMLVVHELKRESGGQSSNLYVFIPCPFAQAEPPAKEKLDHHKTNINLKTKTKELEKNRNARANLVEPAAEVTKVTEITSTPEILDHTFTNDKVPSLFVNLVKVFYNNCERIEEFWRMANIAAHQYVFEHDRATVLDTAIASFKQTVRSIKKRTIKNVPAYFYTIAKNKFGEAFHSHLSELSTEESTMYRHAERTLSWLS